MAQNDIYDSEGKYKRFKDNLLRLTEPPSEQDKRHNRLYYCKNTENLEYFRKLFAKWEAQDISYVRRNRLLQTLGVKEKRIIAAFKKGSPVGSITDKLVKRLFDAIYDATGEAVASGRLDDHYDVRFEFVNRSEFVSLVRQVIKDIRAKVSSRSVFAKDVSEQVITAFVHLFREQYNAKQK